MKEGRNRVYVAKEKLELLRPNSKSDGFLEKDDAIYVIKRFKIDDKSYFQFRVIKFFETKNETNTYTSEIKYFKKMFPKIEKSSITGETENSNKKNYKVPILTTLGGGALGYLFGNKFGGTIKWIIGGMIIGGAVGIYLIKNKDEKK
jgi:hypothetical protein